MNVQQTVLEISCYASFSFILYYCTLGCADDRMSDFERITVYFKSQPSYKCIHLPSREPGFSCELFCSFVIPFRVFACLIFLRSSQQLGSCRAGLHTHYENTPIQIY